MIFLETAFHLILSVPIKLGIKFKLFFFDLLDASWKLFVVNE